MNTIEQGVITLTDYINSLDYTPSEKELYKIAQDIDLHSHTDQWELDNIIDIVLDNIAD